MELGERPLQLFQLLKELRKLYTNRNLLNLLQAVSGSNYCRAVFGPPIMANTAVTHYPKYEVIYIFILRRSQWPRGLWRRSAAARLLRSWVRIPPGAWMFVCCVCRVLSGRGLCDELITRPEESYRLCCVVVCDLETSRIGAPYIYTTLGSQGLKH